MDFVYDNDDNSEDDLISYMHSTTMPPSSCDCPSVFNRSNFNLNSLIQEEIISIKNNESNHKNTNNDVKTISNDNNYGDHINIDNFNCSTLTVNNNQISTKYFSKDKLNSNFDEQDTSNIADTSFIDTITKSISHFLQISLIGNRVLSVIRVIIIDPFLLTTNAYRFCKKILFGLFFTSIEDNIEEDQQVSTTIVQMSTDNTSIVPMSKSDPADEVIDFIRNFIEKYGSPVPPFYHGSFTQVKKDCISESRRLLVYLHDKKCGDCDQFCTNILCNQNTIEYIEQNFMFWACDKDSQEIRNLIYNDNIHQYPFIGLYVPTRGIMELFSRIWFFIEEHHFRNKLNDLVNASKSMIVVEIERRRRAAENVQIRKEQDDNYDKSLKIDREKKRIKIEKEQLEHEMAEKAKEDALRIAKLREAAKLMINDNKEPNVCGSDAVCLSFRLSNGTNFRRNFYLSDKVESLYHYMRSNNEVPVNFQLYTNFPKILLLEVIMDELSRPRNATLQSIGIKWSQSLLVHDIDA
ncbi:hypothetical protein GJ496_010546 [Pomphorhynchus laevis]|nr:hypothetical protein GJ496_010546 [Pomphorhynchus laevis]